MSQEKIQEIVTKYGAEIYTKPKQFIAIISDYFPNDNLGALLKKVIEEGSKDIYKLKGLSGNELNINYTKTLDMISNKTFIAKDVILPALDLLCIGLGVSTSTIPKPAQPAPVVTPVEQPIPTNTPAKPVTGVDPLLLHNTNNNDFESMLDTLGSIIENSEIDEAIDTIGDAINEKINEFGDFFTDLGNIFK